MRTQDAESPLVELRILSQPRCAAGVRDMIAALSRRMGFDKAGAGQIALAVDEAIANVIHHGYNRKEDGPIWVRIYTLDEQGAVNPRCGDVRAVRIVIEDEGRQVDPQSIRGRDLDDIRPGGLGVHIIKHYMDDVRFEKRDDAGMKLTMTRRLDSTKPTAPVSGDR